MNTYTNKIIIQCPEEIATYWGNNLPDLFEGNNLNLRIPSRYYAKTKDGRGAKLVKGAAKARLDTDTIFLGFRLFVPDNREDLRICLTELANYTAGQDSCDGNPLTIIDYHYRHDRVDRDRGYRERVGIFVGNISEVKGSVTKGRIDCQGAEFPIPIINQDDSESLQVYGSGFGFRFSEIVPVGYF